MADEREQTQRMWETDLTEPGRRMTLAELRAMEAMHVCQMMQQLVEAMQYQAKYLQSIEGRLDRIEQYLLKVDDRYPKTAQPQLTGPPALAAAVGIEV